MLMPSTSAHRAMTGMNADRRGRVVEVALRERGGLLSEISHLDTVERARGSEHDELASTIRVPPRR